MKQSGYRLCIYPKTITSAIEPKNFKYPILMSESSFILTTQNLVSSADADFQQIARPGALINFFIQAAWQQAEELHFGHSHLSKDGFGWILSRFTIEFERFPSWTEKVCLKTWPKGTDKLFYLRDCTMEDEKGATLARLTSSWLIIDIERKRPQRPLVDNPAISALQHNHAISEPTPTLCFEFNGLPVLEYKVAYSDIDLYQHLTTTRYIDLTFNTYPLDFLSKNAPKRLTVNLIKEIPAGTLATMYRQELPHCHRFELRSETDTLHYRAELCF